MAKVKEFYCGRCAIRMKIEVEPDYTKDELKAEYKESLEWIDKVKDCPACGYELTQ